MEQSLWKTWSWWWKSGLWLQWSGLKWWWNDDNDDDEPITIIVSMEQSPRKSSSGKDWSHFQSNPASQVLLFSTASVEKCKCHSTSSSVTPLFAQHKITLTLWQHPFFLANLSGKLIYTGKLNHFLRAGMVCNSASCSQNLAHNMWGNQRWVSKKVGKCWR